MFWLNVLYTFSNMCVIVFSIISDVHVFIIDNTYVKKTCKTHNFESVYIVINYENTCRILSLVTHTYVIQYVKYVCTTVYTIIKVFVS